MKHDNGNKLNLINSMTKNLVEEQATPERLTLAIKAICALTQPDTVGLYRVDEQGALYQMIDGEPVYPQACCYACDDQRQQGHFLCEEPDVKLLIMEKQGKVHRSLQDNQWGWFAS